MQYSSSDKKSVQVLVEQCYKFGLKHVVISPGSRNAPLIIAFGNHPDFTCYSIPDERSAGFYALGMARHLNEPVALVCTSGTAVLNYAPALTEAYYQEIPVIAITADRPPYMIDQEDGQTIRQDNVFANHINYSCTLPLGETEDALTLINSDLTKAFEKALAYPKGPVHINIPFEEPLYNQSKISFEVKITNQTDDAIEADSKQLEELSDLINNFDNILILSGVNQPDKDLNSIIDALSLHKNIPVLAPPTANLQSKNVFNSIDLLFYAIKKEELESFQPDVLITIGGPVVSKVVKQYLRANQPKFHIDIDENPSKIDTYNALTHHIIANPSDVFSQLQKSVNSKADGYLKSWHLLSNSSQKKESSFFTTLEFCDLKVYDTFFKSIPEPIDLHLGNSTPVRYAEFFNKNKDIHYFCNRGTSGIDGSTSTAAGAALISGKPTYLLSGDISFVYDSNALWNRHVPGNLKIIVINNQGGNIFRVINGPASTPQLKDFFETHQSANIQKLCDAFGINYLTAKDEITFQLQLETLHLAKTCTVLEVFTNNEISASRYKGLINAIRD